MLMEVSFLNIIIKDVERGTIPVARVLSIIF